MERCPANLRAGCGTGRNKRCLTSARFANQSLSPRRAGDSDPGLRFHALCWANLAPKLSSPGRFNGRRDLETQTAGAVAEQLLGQFAAEVDQLLDRVVYVRIAQLHRAALFAALACQQ